MADHALKPCPFCGFDKPKLRSNGIGDSYVHCDSDDDSDPCCGASSSDRNCETERGAADRWNRRVGIQQIENDTAECQRCHKQAKDTIWSGERTVCWDCAREIGFEDLRASGGIVGSP